MQNVFDTKAFRLLLKDSCISTDNWKGAGVAVPVFSLKSNYDFGIGEFLDLKILADWCHQIGLKMIQILPINDTRTDGSWDNSYPYKAISTKALHPIFLNLYKMGMLDSLYREAKVESVEYGTTVDVVAVCNPRLLGQLRDYVEGWQEEKEDWEL